MKIFKAVIFAKDEHRFPPQTIEAHTRQKEIYLPVDAIAYLEATEPGANNSSFKAFIKKEYEDNLPFKPKSISSIIIPFEMVDLLK